VQRQDIDPVLEGIDQTVAAAGSLEEVHLGRSRRARCPELDRHFVSMSLCRAGWASFGDPKQTLPGGGWVAGAIRQSLFWP